MPALVAGIHAIKPPHRYKEADGGGFSFHREARHGVDGRHKAGHDGKVLA